MGDLYHNIIVLPRHCSCQLVSSHKRLIVFYTRTSYDIQCRSYIRQRDIDLRMQVIIYGLVHPYVQALAIVA